MTSLTLKSNGKLQSALDKIAARLKTQAVVKVGFLSGAEYPDGTSVAMVAAIQEFGAPSKNIPPRPFFRNMIALNSSHWGTDLGAMLKFTNYDGDKALGLLGQQMQGELKDSISNLYEPPLKPGTIAARKPRSEKPLVYTGFLLSRVDYEVVS